MPASTSFQSDWKRVNILKAFVAAILISLPIWWKTTSIERLTLPRSELRRWGEGDCAFPIHVGLRLDLDKSFELQDPAATLQYIDEVGLRANVLLQVKADALPQSSVCLRYSVIPGDAHRDAAEVQRAVELARWQEQHQVPTDSEDPEAAPIEPPSPPEHLLPITKKEERYALDYRILLTAARDEPASYNLTLQASDPSPSTVAVELVSRFLDRWPLQCLAPGACRRSAGVASNAAIQHERNVELVFSLVHEDATAGGAFQSWSLDQLLSPEHSELGRTLQSLGKVYDLKIESQMLFYAPLAFQPKRVITSTPRKSYMQVEEEVEEPSDDPDEPPRIVKRKSMRETVINTEREEFVVEPDDLQIFVNAGDWSLGDSSSEVRTLHFLLYVPSKTYAPLRIRDPRTQELNTTKSWIVPQWGGVVLYDRPSPRLTEGSQALAGALNDAILQQASVLWATHLQALLGVPRVGEDKRAPTAEEIDVLGIARIGENVQNSIDTLGSIVSLVDKLSNLGVDAKVKADFVSSLEALEKVSSGVRISVR